MTQESSLLKIDPAEWSRVAGGRGLYVSHPWLLAVEADEENTDAATYLLVRENGVLRAALPVYRRHRRSYDDFYDPIAQFLPPGGATDRAAPGSDGWYPSCSAGPSRPTGTTC